MTTERTPAEQLRHATAEGVRWVTLARVTIEVLLIVSMVVLARIIPPADFGRYAVTLIAFELALAVSGEGVGSALVQRDEVTRAHMQAGGFLTLVVASVLTVLALIASTLVVGPVFGDATASLMRLTAPMFLIAAVGAVPMALLRRQLAFRRLSVIDIAGTFARAGSAVVLAIIGLNGAALVLGGLIGTVVATVLALISAPVPFPRPHRQAIRDISGYGIPASLAAVSWIGFRNCDYTIVAARLGAVSAGLYFRAYTLGIDYQRKISIVMYQVAFPVLSRTASTTELFALRGRMVRVLTVILFPCLALLAILAPVVVPFMFGPAWTGAIVPTQILCVAGASTLVIDAVGTTLMAAGRASAMLGYGVAHFLTYAVAVFFLCPFGLSAVAAGAAVVHTAFLLVAYVLLLRGHADHPLGRLWADTSAALVSCAGLLAVALPIHWALDAAGTPGAVQLLAVTVVGGGAYLLVLHAAFSEAWGELVTIVRALLPSAWTAARTDAPPLPPTGSVA